MSGHGPYPCCQSGVLQSGNILRLALGLSQSCKLYLVAASLSLYRFLADRSAV